MDFHYIVESILKEEMTSGGEGSVFGTGVVATATEFSGDNYAKEDGRNVVGGVYGPTLTRMGTVGKKRKSKNNKRKSRKRRS